MDLALNNLQRLIYHKTQQTNQTFHFLKQEIDTRNPRTLSNGNWIIYLPPIKKSIFIKEKHF